MINLKKILEALLFAQTEPISIDMFLKAFSEHEQPEHSEIESALLELQSDYHERAIALECVASGWRFQTRVAYSPWIHRILAQKPPSYSKAFLETLAIIAYKQPITRSEIEAIRGVAVNSNYIRLMQERSWITIAGYKETPGRPALYKTTAEFLDYFNLKHVDDLPILRENTD